MDVVSPGEEEVSEIVDDNLSFAGNWEGQSGIWV